MQLFKRFLLYTVSTPSSWLLTWYFQPNKFEKELEKRNRRERLLFFFRLFLPLSIFSYVLTFVSAVLVRVTLQGLTIPFAHIVLVLALGTLGGIFLGTLVGIAFGLAEGIGISFIIGITIGLAIDYIPKTIAGDVTSGLAGGLIIYGITAIAGSRAGRNLVSGLLIGVGVGLPFGLILGRFFGGFIGTISGNIIGIAVGIGYSRVSSGAVGSVVNRGRGITIGLILSIIVGIGLGGLGGIVCTVSYLCIFYRLPVYPISCLSGLWAYLASYRQPRQVFTYLHRCSLYWDECLYLPLIGLKRMLLIATGQNEQQALEEIAFIVNERPSQIYFARETLLEVTIADLEKRDSLRDIAQVSVRLAEIFPSGTALIDPQWAPTIARLNRVSQDADRACNPLGWHAKHNALTDMAADLRRFRVLSAFRSYELNNRLDKVVAMWMTVMQREIEKLERVPEKTRRFYDPYSPGLALELDNPLFVGRRELIQQLSEALRRSDGRPTFLLHGERRMGKSTILKQLPNLLGPHYFSVFFDLQSRGISSSTLVFLSTIAEEIFTIMHGRGLKIQQLDFRQLKQASKENEAAIYYVFNRWLKTVEKVLEREDCTLLLNFDEFEKLDLARQAGYLDLQLLLDWFRHITQHHLRVALLFSGIQALNDMKMSWATYFVNVQVLKVSFLQREDAYQLITQPLSNFPSKHIFSEEIVQEIMRLTHCHPFLIQALCSALIHTLNMKKEDRLDLQDMREAVLKLCKNWGPYFQDAWDRADTKQHKCLLSLHQLKNVCVQTLEQQSDLEKRTVQRTLDMLVDRDLVVAHDNTYQIATPIFSTWIELNVLT